MLHTTTNYSRLLLVYCNTANCPLLLLGSLQAGVCCYQGSKRAFGAMSMPYKHSAAHQLSLVTRVPSIPLFTKSSPSAMAMLSLVPLLLAASASASFLFSTSYNDHSLNILWFNGSSLSVFAKNFECGSEPTWLTLNYAKNALYCLNEGWGGNASITSYSIGGNGTSVKSQQILRALKSPVASTLLGTQQEDLAVAY